jgi:hypothetical protein
MSIMLKNFDIYKLKPGMRVQSFETKHEGEIALVDIDAQIVWIKWSPNQSIVPHTLSKLNNVFSIDQ